MARLIKTTLNTKPADGSTHWSVRTVAAEIGISKSSMQRYFQLSWLQPHRSMGLKLFNDPFFNEKLRDVVGLYRSPPENALVLCVDEKSQCQALERTQPMPPMGFGDAEVVTHDYKRHGTTTLFAALNVLNGAALATYKPRHRRQKFLSFPRGIDKALPLELDVDCIVDNNATHSHSKVKAWLASRPNRRLHFIPTYSSELDQVERFFALITDKAIRRGSFTSVKQLVQRIDQFVTHHNTNSQPFRWAATADSILGKRHRLCSRISGAGHQVVVAKEDGIDRGLHAHDLLKHACAQFKRRRSWIEPLKAGVVQACFAQGFAPTIQTLQHTWIKLGACKRDPQPPALDQMLGEREGSLRLCQANAKPRLEAGVFTDLAG